MMLFRMAWSSRMSSQASSRIPKRGRLASLEAQRILDLVLLKVIFYFWPFLRAFWGLFFVFSRVFKQIQVEQQVILGIFSSVFECFVFAKTKRFGGFSCFFWCFIRVLLDYAGAVGCLQKITGA